MPANNGNKKISMSYREKYGWDMPTKKLARIMYNENSLHFSNEEGARKSLRDLENKAGTKVKNYVKIPDRPKNPYNLPASDESDWKPFIITAKKTLILSDIHAPYHNLSALTAVFDYAKAEKPDCVVLNGDLFDFHGLSKYTRDPKKKRFSQELDIAADIIKLIKKHITENIIFKLGNHDERYQHFLWMKAGEISDVEDFQLHNLIVKRAGPIVTVGDKRIIKASHLNIVHGHEFISGSGMPASVAKSFYDKSKTSTLGGHHHKTSEYTVTDMNGSMTTTYSAGCLSELHPQYMPINQWNHGAAMVTVENDAFHVHNFRIDNGKIY